MIASDVCDTAGGPLVIQPVRHTSFAIGYKDLVIFVDPADCTAEFETLEEPNLILYTHQHGDHFNLATLTALADSGTALIMPRIVLDEVPGELHERARLVAPGDVTSFADIGITVLPAYNLAADRQKYHPRSMGGVGYVLDFAGTRLYISGDTEDVPEMRALSGIDIAFLPMNAPYTMSGAQAADAAMTFRPRIVYPFHYHGGVEHEIFAGLLHGTAGTEIRLRDWYAED